jgi:sugar phosphate isomerase/epimerase
MFILGRTQMILVNSYEEALKRIMAKGFDGVEIDIYNRDFQPRDDFYEEGFPARMKELMLRYEVKALSVGAHMDYTESETKFNAVKNAIPVASELGSSLIIINGPHKKENEPFELQWNRQIEATKELCKTAEQYHVFLAMEFEPGFVIDSTELMLKAFSEIDSPMMRVNADIGHMFLLDPDPLKAIEQCGRYIVHCHMENMKRGIHNHLVPYEGDMNLPEYIAKLRSIGFDGPASFDVYQYDYEAVAEKSVQYFKSIFVR